MLKPIVSMNQMAMNESIATTCCYVWNGTSLLGSASLPHGGSLVAKSTTTSYVQLGDTRVKLNGTWYNYTAGHANNAYVASCVVSTNAKGEIGFHTHGANGENGQWWAMATADKADVAPALNGYCDHVNNPNCPYFKETKYTGEFKHTGATSAHYTWTSGNSWLQDHDAVQFSS